MLPRVFQHRIQGQTRELDHLVHETWRPSCVRFDLKLYKIRTESENHESRREALTGYVESMKKNLGMFGASCGTTWLNPEISTCDNEISHAEISGFNHLTAQLASNISKKNL
jgi:hypothetical protein